MMVLLVHDRVVLYLLNPLRLVLLVFEVLGLTVVVFVQIG